MTHSMSAVAILLALSGGFTGASSQAAPTIVGKWNIEYARGQRVENDVVTNIMAKGTITIAVSGDSLLATLDQPPRPDGSPTPTAMLGGRLVNGQAVFVQKQTVQLNMDGQMHSAEAITTWTLLVTGDAMTGGIARDIPSMPMPPRDPSPVTGTRSKA